MLWGLGQHYTRDEIHEALGGSRQSFLPWKNGVVAACLKPNLNPDAPRVVLPGHGSERERAADWLCAHPQHGIPVFLKRDVRKWEYVGVYRCTSWSDNPEEIRNRAPVNRRDEVYRVLFMELVE